MGISVGYKNQSNRARSPAIWGRLPIQKWYFGEDPGFFFYDDFLVTSGTGWSADSGVTYRYQSYIDANCTIEGLTTDAGGVLRHTHDGTDNDQTGLATNGGGSTGATNMCVFDTDTPNIIAFECRIRKSNITDDTLGFFIGLAEENLANVNTLANNTAALADKDFIGFHLDNSASAGSGALVDFVYKKAGQTAVTVITSVATMVASTWIRLGFLFNPFDHPASKAVKVFVDGTEQSTYIANSALDDATFPDDQELGMLVATKLGTATASTFDMDWWACGGSL